MRVDKIEDESVGRGCGKTAGTGGRMHDILTEQDLEGDKEDAVDDVVDGDSACALCRKCQMRRRLEKKVAERNASRKLDGDDRGCRMGRSITPNVKAQVIEDKRSIDELLSFINGQDKSCGMTVTDGSKAKKTRSKRKAKRPGKVAASTSGRGEGHEQVKTGHGDHGDCSDPDTRDEMTRSSESASSPRGCTGAASSCLQTLGDLELVVPSDPHREEGYSVASSACLRTQNQVSSCEREQIAENCCAWEFPPDEMQNETEMELPSDVEQEIEREVEAFRVRLAETSESFVGHKLKPMSILDFNMCKINIIES